MDWTMAFSPSDHHGPLRVYLNESASMCGFNAGMTTIQHAPRSGEAAFSIPSVLAFIAAIASFAVSPGFQLILSIVAAVLGVVGVLLSLMPGVRGGIISILSLLAGGLGFIIAIIRLIASL